MYLGAMQRCCTSTLSVPTFNSSHLTSSTSGCDYFEPKTVFYLWGDLFLVRWILFQAWNSVAWLLWFPSWTILKEIIGHQWGKGLLWYLCIEWRGISVFERGDLHLPLSDNWNLNMIFPDVLTNTVTFLIRTILLVKVFYFNNCFCSCFLSLHYCINCYLYERYSHHHL